MNRTLKTVLIDLSGTLHIENEAVPGALQALQRLRQTALSLKFVTNTTKESKRDLHSRLTNLGFQIESSEIFTSLTAARNVIETRRLRPHFMLEDSALEDFRGLDTDNPNAVVIGLAPSKFNYDNLTKAFRMILDGSELIAIHKARYYKRSDGLALGPGPFVAGLEYATGVQPTVVGKPEKQFFLQALADLNCAPENACMIGDDVRDDVIGGQECGLLGILVQTGKYREGDETKHATKPDVVVKDFPQAVQYIIENFT